MEIYFFAETPRADSDHPAIVPVLHEVPVTIIDKYIPKVRNGETGYDFIGVCQPAPRKRLEKIDTSTETLVVAVPDYDLNRAPNKEKIREKLKSFLGQIETIHDWSDETRSVVPLQIFDQWYNEIVSLIPKKLKPINSNGKKGNWFMRHKLLCAVMVLLLFVVSSVTLIGQPITDLFERLKIPTRPINPEPPPQAKALQTWLAMLGEKTDNTNEQLLQQQLHDKLQSLLKLPATQNNLQTILNNLKRCFDSGKDKLPTEQQSLDTLLDDGN
ncbi:MAG: hypothetical protein LBQ50_08050, partial [Planctomycetaceae bacterium]|nr:hypothetical protein [Planctomycetaceae bacterium]